MGGGGRDQIGDSRNSTGQSESIEKERSKMKTMRTVSAALCALALLGRVSLARATHEPQTITGEGKCAKCILNEGDTHPTVIQVKERDKTVNYYLAKNEAAKMVDKKFCEKPQKVTATGIVKEVKGKLELSATKVELVKDAK
jgi:hypothetical protein